MGLRANDLHDMIKPVFEVDTYQSKMGTDGEVVVVSFTVNEEQAATDLVDFIEKGYGFVLDADHTPGEVEKGVYKVFVEMERNNDVPGNIGTLLDGVGKLGEIDNFRFRYHKSFSSYEANDINLSEMIPATSSAYEQTVTETRMDHFKDFFSNSFFENSEMFGDTLIVKKPYADPIGFEVKDFSDTLTMNKKLTEKINMNDYPEIMFLTKYLGDYNITKFGNKTLTLENNGYTLVVERL
tara:strand:+ start:60 stop:776 length:717 start_codon:yes stop_codon:yes gene_type:complete